MLKYTLPAIALTIATVSSCPAFANDEADQAIRQRNLEQYAVTVAAKYPTKTAYILNNKTPVGQALADAVYTALKKQGGEAYVYEGLSRSEGLSSHDYKSVEMTDVFFCGCTADEAEGINTAVVKQGFTGKFVALTDPK